MDSSIEDQKNTGKESHRKVSFQYQKASILIQTDDRQEFVSKIFNYFLEMKKNKRHSR